MLLRKNKCHAIWETVSDILLFYNQNPIALSSNLLVIVAALSTSLSTSFKSSIFIERSYNVLSLGALSKTFLLTIPQEVLHQSGQFILNRYSW